MRTKIRLESVNWKPIGWPGTGLVHLIWIVHVIVVENQFYQNMPDTATRSVSSVDYDLVRDESSKQCHKFELPSLCHLFLSYVSVYVG